MARISFRLPQDIDETDCREFLETAMESGKPVRAVDELTRALALNDRFDPVQAGVAQNLLLSPGG